VQAAADAMGGRAEGGFTPDEQRADAYDRLYAEYSTLHDYFGRGGNDVMHRLAALRREAWASRGEKSDDPGTELPA
jgi:L-ribulokinase